jgi:hypothetical protein
MYIFSSFSSLHRVNDENDETEATNKAIDFVESLFEVYDI